VDDTAEILERLERIGSLAGAGAERSDLLREVRGLLEEGERRLHVERRKERGREAPRRCEPARPPDAATPSSSLEGAGKEATVA
jgi:hypothetical protein